MWFSIKNQEVNINILAKPNAKKTALLKIDEQGLHVSLHAKPHHGEANKELISFLAKLFKVPKTQISLQRGQGSKYKKVTLPLTSTVQALLEEWSIIEDFSSRS